MLYDKIFKIIILEDGVGQNLSFSYRQIIKSFNKKHILMTINQYETYKYTYNKEHLFKEKRERKRNVLFNNALNTFYLRLYGVRHMVKDHSDSEKGNLLLPHRLLLSINSKGSFI